MEVDPAARSLHGCSAGFSLDFYFFNHGVLQRYFEVVDILTAGENQSELKGRGNTVGRKGEGSELIVA